MGAKNMTREARDMELQWFDIRELTEDAAQTVIGMMDETRRRRVADIAGEDDRKRTIAGELLARRMLAQTMGCAEKDVPLQWDELGKPSVEKDGVYVSVSHSGPWAVCVTADAPVGVDVEVVRSAQEKFMRRVCSEQEMVHTVRGRRRLPAVLGDMDGQGGAVQADGQGSAAGAEPLQPAGRRNAGLYGTKGLRPHHRGADFVKNFAKLAKKAFLSRFLLVQ